MNYAQRHLWEAVATLATGEGQIQERLRHATPHLLKADMNFDEIPPSLQATYKELYRDLTAVDDPRLGSVEATISRLSGPDASGLASRILNLFAGCIELATH